MRFLLIPVLAVFTVIQSCDDRQQADALAAGRLQITTTKLPAAIVNQQYFAQLQATGGRPPYQWKVLKGKLPAGLILNSGNGQITGTPLTSACPTGQCPVKVTFGVRDSS